MSSGSGPPPMSHSAAYYDRRNSPRSPHLRQQYPPSPSLSRPAPARLVPSNKVPVSSRRTDPNRAHSSVSSGESGSTVASDFKPYPNKQTYHYGSQAERGLVGEDAGRRSYLSSPAHTEAPIGSLGQSEMIEDQSAVFRYIQQQQADDEADKVDDHAIWILVSGLPSVCVSAGANVRSYGCPSWIPSTVFSVPFSRYSPSSPSSYYFPCEYADGNLPLAPSSYEWLVPFSGTISR